MLLSHDISIRLFGYHCMALGSYSRIGFSIPLLPIFDISFSSLSSLANCFRIFCLVSFLPITLWVPFEVLSIFSEFFDFFFSICYI